MVSNANTLVHSLGKIGVMKYLWIPFAFIVVFLCISSASILVLLSKASSISCAFWRLFISSIIVWFTALLKNKWRSVFSNKRILALTFISGFSLAVHFLLWMESLFWIPVSISTSIVVTYPLFILVFDYFVLKERITYLQVLGLIGGFLGVLLFTHPRILGTYSVYGVFLALGGSLMASVYFIIGRVVRRKIGLLEYVVPTYSFASLTLFLYAVVVGENLIGYPPRTFMYFILLALLPMIGGHTVMNYLLRFLKASIVTSIALGEPVGASLLAYYILGQEIGWSRALAMGVVLFSLALVISSGAEERYS